VYTLGNAGFEGIISLIIFGIVAINVIAQVVKYAKKQQREESEGPERTSDSGAADGAAPRNDLQRFLEELSRQAQGSMSQRPQPTPSSTPRPPVKPVQPAQPPQIPVARPVAKTYPVAAPVPYRKKVVRKAPVAMAEDETQTKGLIVKAKKGRPEGLSVAPPTTAGVSSGKTTMETAADRMEEQLPKETLKRAVALRELLGPCRAQHRYLPGRW